MVLSETFQIQKQLKKRLINYMWMDFNMYNVEINGLKHVHYISEKRGLLLRNRTVKTQNQDRTKHLISDWKYGSQCSILIIIKALENIQQKISYYQTIFFLRKYGGRGNLIQNWGENE